MANLYASKGPRLVELAAEAAEYRHYRCPTHGQIGLRVDGDGRCRRKGCGEICKRDGDLITPPEKIMAMVKATAEVGVVMPQALAELGLKDGPKTVENHLHLTSITYEQFKALPASEQAVVERFELAKITGRPVTSDKSE